MNTKSSGKDDRVAGFLKTILDEFDDDNLRRIFADFLAETFGPTRVRSHHVPDWLRRAWVRDRPDNVLWCGHGTAGSVVRAEIQDWLGQSLGRQALLSGVSHDGSTVIGGFRCWVTEPLADEQGALRYLRPLARHLGCVDAFTRCTWRSRYETWPGGPVRIVLFPPRLPRGET
jgi:hypothetical protein